MKISSYPFRDLFVDKASPLEIEFGHISETPKGWEERFERQNHDHKVNRHQGKVRRDVCALLLRSIDFYEQFGA
jgi:hypothetical protein